MFTSFFNLFFFVFSSFQQKYWPGLVLLVWRRNKLASGTFVLSQRNNGRVTAQNLSFSFSLFLYFLFHWAPIMPSVKDNGQAFGLSNFSWITFSLLQIWFGLFGCVLCTCVCLCVCLCVSVLFVCVCCCFVLLPSLLFVVVLLALTLYISCCRRRRRCGHNQTPTLPDNKHRSLPLSFLFIFLLETSFQLLLMWMFGRCFASSPSLPPSLLSFSSSYDLGHLNRLN